MVLSFLMSYLKSLLTVIFYHIYVLFTTRVNQFAQYITRHDLFRKSSKRAYSRSSPDMLKAHKGNVNVDYELRDGDSNEKISFQPLTGGCLPRYAGMATLMRLPYLELSTLKASNVVDVGLIGIPWDGGTTNRPGARMGPRAVRDISTSVRNVNRASGINPFTLSNCADLGDCPVNPLDVMDALKRITGFYKEVVEKDISPLSVGGDHLVSLPVLRALAPKHPSPLGLIHFDAHSDTWDSYFGDSNKYSHGTGFRRAIEEGLIDPHKTIQIGLRGALYADALDDWGVEQGITQIDMEDFRRMGVDEVLASIHRVVGDSPSYVSFDIDVLDPAFACGTGTPEIGGITTHEAQMLIRGLQGVHMVGGDLVEVAPAYDPSSNTALAGATLLYEMLCILSNDIATRNEEREARSRPPYQQPFTSSQLN